MLIVNIIWIPSLSLLSLPVSLSPSLSHSLPSLPPLLHNCLFFSSLFIRYHQFPHYQLILLPVFIIQLVIWRPMKGVVYFVKSWNRSGVILVSFILLLEGILLFMLNLCRGNMNIDCNYCIASHLGVGAYTCSTCTISLGFSWKCWKQQWALAFINFCMYHNIYTIKHSQMQLHKVKGWSLLLNITIISWHWLYLGILWVKESSPYSPLALLHIIEEETWSGLSQVL